MNAPPPRAKLLHLLKALYQHLTPRRRSHLALLVGLVIANSAAEVISLGAVLPFLATVIDPDRAFNSSFVRTIAGAVGITSADQLLVPTTIAFAAAAIIAGAIRLALLWANTRLAFSIGAELSIEVYRRTLYQPYRVHIARNTSEVLSGITRKVDGVVTGVLLPVLTLLGSAVLLVAIVTALFAIDPIVAAAAMLSFGSCYGLLTYFSRRRIYRDSHQIAAMQTHVFRALQEGLSGIRDVLLDGSQERYSRDYQRADQPLRRASGSVLFISQSPRFAMEALGMVLIAGLAYALAAQPGGATATLPVLGALALGGQRLLPALQQSYAAWSSIIGYQGILADTIVLLDQPLPEHAGLPPPPPLAFDKEIQFDNVRFRYAETDNWVLDGVNITIRKGSRIGLVGATGSGKSTACDILMGLLEPTEGHLRVDGSSVTGPAIQAWQRNVAHVPQSIYLIDATFAENIALGEPSSNIDMERVRRAARQAQIADFIESDPLGYDAPTGENGVRLSGGQRQRIGIARALYKHASILILDEATSALDNATEASVMSAIDDLSPDLTMVLIAHRLTTLRNCDLVVQLDHGRVLAAGAYNQIVGEDGLLLSPQTDPKQP